MKRTIFILFLLCAFGIGVVAHAQFNAVPQADINVDLSPENPGPNQTVTVTLTSFSTNLDAGKITYSINGAVKKSGNGLKTFSFTTGGINTTTTLGIAVRTSEGDTVQKTIRIQPVSVDLVWQSESFVPPFYKGKALFSYQNKITFVALPHINASGGGEISDKNLIYKWTQNGEVIGNASGYGRNTYTTVGSIIARPIDVEVEVTSGNSPAVGSAEIVVNPITPLVLFYKKNPLYGIEFQNALVGKAMLGDSQEVTVVGIPLFFGVANSSSGSLSYSWSINGEMLDGAYQNTRVFRRTEGVSGASNISLSVENANKILQSASSNFSLEFGQPAKQTGAF